MMGWPNEEKECREVVYGVRKGAVEREQKEDKVSVIEMLWLKIHSRAMLVMLYMSSYVRL